MFAEITRKRLRRGTFRSVRELIKTINEYIRLYNKNPRPFPVNSPRQPGHPQSQQI
jgi:hypothetical protein